MKSKRKKEESSLLVPIRYLPLTLSREDKAKQTKFLLQSRNSYRKHKYVSRPKLASFHNKTSKHIRNARRIYHVDKISPTKTLAQKTKCSIGALQRIVKKGEGAYFSSGSRPNQTARSWGIARLASSITAGKAAAVDFHILSEGCNHRGKAYQLAKQARRKYGYGQSHTKRIRCKVDQDAVSNFDMEEKYVWCMSVGHGSIIRDETRVNYVPLQDMGVKVTACQIAAPTEPCVYPPDLILQIKDWLVKNESMIPDTRVEEFFQQSIEHAQQDALGYMYRSDIWSGYAKSNVYSARSQHTEYYAYDLHRNNQLPNKFFSEETKVPQVKDKCGIYIIKNNVGLTNGRLYRFQEGFQTLSDIIETFQSENHVKKLYLVDFTCSVLSDRASVSTRTTRSLAREMIKNRAGGKTRRRRLRNCGNKKKQSCRRRCRRPRNNRNA